MQKKIKKNKNKFKEHKKKLIAFIWKHLRSVQNLLNTTSRGPCTLKFFVKKTI